MTEPTLKPDDLQFVYNLLLDKSSMTMREALAAQSIFERIAALLFPKEEAPTE